MIQAKKNQNKFKAFFSPESNYYDERSPYSIYIIKSRDRFNDFGYRSRVKLKFFGEDLSQFVELEGLIGFLDGVPHGQSSLEEIVSDAKGLDVPVTAESHRFFTILPDMQSYRHLVGKFGPQLAQEVLVAANDLVALKESCSLLRLHELAER